jgi:hypothetical protein
VVDPVDLREFAVARPLAARLSQIRANSWGGVAR